MKTLAFTLDLEPDYAGLVGGYKIFENTREIEEILARISSLGAKITVFVVGEIFEKYPHIIKIFEKFNCEFEAHSYTHNVDRPDIEDEISKSRQAYFNYFGKHPRGYRVPQGRVSDKTVRLLKKYNFLYDSSIFPSYYPNPFRYLFCKRCIYYTGNTDIVEIPFTSITPLRFTLSLSYLKLLGINFFLESFRLFGLPDNICFNTHLHDFIVKEESFSRLPKFWKFIYGRNKFKGIDFCTMFLEYAKDQGYRFKYMSKLYEAFVKDKQLGFNEKNDV
ncbi:MAG: polysaccharide deacetylase family protein [Candidatus Omnitrophota bacterium]